jgi:hypothetical protein
MEQFISNTPTDAEAKAIINQAGPGSCMFRRSVSMPDKIAFTYFKDSEAYTTLISYNATNKIVSFYDGSILRGTLPSLKDLFRNAGVTMIYVNGDYRHNVSPCGLISGVNHGCPCSLTGIMCNRTNTL